MDPLFSCLRKEGHKVLLFYLLVGLFQKEVQRAHRVVVVVVVYLLALLFLMLLFAAVLLSFALMFVVV